MTRRSSHLVPPNSAQASGRHARRDDRHHDPHALRRAGRACRLHGGADDEGVRRLRRQRRLQPGARRLVRVRHDRLVADRRLGGERQRVRRRSHGAADAKSLAISATGKAVSPSFCVGVRAPDVPPVRAPTSGNVGRAERQAALRSDAGGDATRPSSARSRPATRRGIPTAPIALSTVLGMWNADQSASVAVVFDPEDSGGAWAIDDVYIDPYSRN